MAPSTAFAHQDIARDLGVSIMSLIPVQSRMRNLVLPGFVLFASFPMTLAATELGSTEKGGKWIPRLGDAVPRSIRVIGLDGEARALPFGMVIVEGRIVVLVKAGTREIVDITSDEPVGGPPLPRSASAPLQPRGEGFQ